MVWVSESSFSPPFRIIEMVQAERLFREISALEEISFQPPSPILYFIPVVTPESVPVLASVALKAAAGVAACAKVMSCGRENRTVPPPLVLT